MFQVGDRVWILIPLADGQLRQGTVYGVYPQRRWPYHVQPDGDGCGVAYRADELAPGWFPRSQVVSTDIPEDDWGLFKAMMGLQ